jgi:hypothetical protein
MLVLRRTFTATRLLHPRARITQRCDMRHVTAPRLKAVRTAPRTMQQAENTEWYVHESLYSTGQRQLLVIRCVGGVDALRVHRGQRARVRTDAALCGRRRTMKVAWLQIGSQALSVQE